VYNSQKLTKTDYKNKSYYVYILLPIFQLVLLIIWTITQNEYTQKRKYSKIAYYDYKICSYKNNSILNIIYAIDFILSVISIIISYKGRKSMY